MTQLRSQSSSGNGSAIRVAGAGGFVVQIATLAALVAVHMHYVAATIDRGRSGDPSQLRLA